jgi:hypothetical protein
MKKYRLLIGATLLLCLVQSPACQADTVLYEAQCAGDTCVQSCGDEEPIIYYYDDENCYCDTQCESYIDSIDDPWPGRKQDSWVDQLTHQCE